MNLERSPLGHFTHFPFVYANQAGAYDRGRLEVKHLFSALLKVSLFIITLLFTINLRAQNTMESPTFLERTDFKVGYFGNITSNQGLNLGMEYLWLENVKIRERRKGQKTIKRQLLLNGSLGYSTNFATQTQNGIFAYSGLTFRRVDAKSRLLSVELNPFGLYRSVLPETYEVNGDNVSTVSFPGRGYYAPSVALGIGRFRRASKRSGWYMNFQFTVLTNYNTGLLPISSLHFGRTFNFSN